MRQKQPFSWKTKQSILIQNETQSKPIIIMNYQNEALQTKKMN